MLMGESDYYVKGGGHDFVCYVPMLISSQDGGIQFPCIILLAQRCDNLDNVANYSQCRSGRGHMKQDGATVR